MDSDDANLFMVKPRSTTGSQILEGFGTSPSAPDARKHVTKDDAAPMEEAKQARLEKH
jgi:hypothetical protein